MGVSFGNGEIRFWAITFTGHYPVGACAVVAAYTESEARELVQAELGKQGLSLDDNDVLEEIEDCPHARIVLNGDY